MIASNFHLTVLLFFWKPLDCSLTQHHLILPSSTWSLTSIPSWRVENLWTSFHSAQSFMATQYCVLHLLQDQATNSCFLKIFSFAFTVVLNFLQLKYQGQDQMSPFQTHPKTMHVAVTSLLIYCLLYDIHQRFSSHPLYRRSSARIISRAMLFFALLSLLSATSLLFPESIKGILYALCILLSVGDWLHVLFQKIKNSFTDAAQVYRHDIMEIMHFPSVEHRLRLPI